jgi:hypothetical protein
MENMKIQNFAPHLFSATMLLVGVSLVVGACSSNTSQDAAQSAGTDQGRPDQADRQASRPPALQVVEPTVLEEVSPAASDDASPQQTVVAQVSRPAGDAVVVRPVGIELTSEPDSSDPSLKEPFEGWGKPWATLFITGQQSGYIEPCGCTGLKTQKGGLNRKYTFITQLREKGWNPVGLDVGNQVRRFGRQPEIKFQQTIVGFRKIGYAAVGLGPKDLKLTVAELLPAFLSPTGDEGDKLFVCANVDVFEMNARYKVIEAGGKKIGVTAIVGEELLKKEAISPEIVITSSDTALKEVWPKLQAEACDVYVLLANTSKEDSKRLAEAFPGFQIVVTAGGFGEPPYEPERLNDNKTWHVQVGTKGMFVGVIGLFDDPSQPLRYQKMPLDARFPDNEAMLDLLSDYQLQLESQGLSGLKVEPRALPTDRKFVGSIICDDCHSKAFGIWKGTPHAHALDTLIKPPERYNVSRHHDPECLSCHVVGWDPQKYFPHKSGYESLQSDKGLHHVGCENCHGPGSKHVAAENGDIDATDEQLEAYRQQMVLTYDKAEDHCKRCHDLDNSPDFHKDGAFEEYWEKVEHVGKD